MRLLAISAWFPVPPRNGATLRAYYLLQQMARRHDVTLLTFAHESDRSNVHPEALSELCTVARVIPHSPVAGRRDTWHGWLSTMPRALAASYSPDMQSAVSRAVPAHELVLGLSQWTAPYLLHGGRCARVLDEFEAGRLQERLEGRGVAALRARLTWWKQARFARRLATALDAVTVVSGEERAAMARMGCDLSRVAVVPNGVSADLLDRSAEPTPGRLVYPGSVTYEPNYDAVRWFSDEVLARIRSSRPDASLVVTGRTGTVPTGGWTAGGAITFTGEVPDVSAEIGRSAVCVVPLRSGGGTRLKVLEAMALGVPVVSTRKGVEGLDLEADRHVLVADSSEAFAAAVIRVLNDTTLARRLATAGRAVAAERFTWDLAGAALNATIEAACARWRARH
jgi:glycosyltransferase involved in cell wall biosynthesis